ncbi:CBS domain-containing protein [Tahibacter amnicola]|uniref:CBS domain-containing protein n=1 Tax=Tahibacter amnicola TaxID=2976241 RepID=A0ABY6B8Y1_9GAMM|nr:CBS domain-containing protein [Tahibacter amnicola]UXI65986.1 CBS domain-containing protein [Tahibacter amnicola]
MRIANLCTRRVISAVPSMSLMEAADLMSRHQVGTLVVVAGTDDARRPVGMLTDRDIVVSVVARGRDPSQHTVAEVMTASIVVCRDDDILFDVVQVMRCRGVRRMPVVDANGVLCGVISADDLIAGISEQLVALVSTVTSSETSKPRDLDDADGVAVTRR